MSITPKTKTQRGCFSSVVLANTMSASNTIEVTNEAAKPANKILTIYKVQLSGTQVLGTRSGTPSILSCVPKCFSYANKK